MKTVPRLPSIERTPWDRMALEVTPEEFILCDEAGRWQHRQHVAGFTILQFPRFALIRCPDGHCVLNGVAGTDLSVAFGKRPPSGEFCVSYIG